MLQVQGCYSYAKISQNTGMSSATMRTRPLRPETSVPAAGATTGGGGSRHDMIPVEREAPNRRDPRNISKNQVMTEPKCKQSLVASSAVQTPMCSNPHYRESTKEVLKLSSPYTLSSPIAEQKAYTFL